MASDTESLEQRIRRLELNLEGLDASFMEATKNFTEAITRLQRTVGNDRVHEWAKLQEHESQRAMRKSLRERAARGQYDADFFNDAWRLWCDMVSESE